jgi:hypothetical protein
MLPILTLPLALVLVLAGTRAARNRDMATRLLDG